jgi:hypothetical protein
MTELFQQVATLEGWEYYPEADYAPFRKPNGEILEADAFCFRLLMTHPIEVTPLPSGERIVSAIRWNHGCVHDEIFQQRVKTQEELEQAVCAAVIALRENE